MLVQEKRSKMKVKVPKGARLTRFLLSPAGKTLLASVAILTVASVGTFAYFYQEYSRIIDQKLRLGPFANTSKIFAGPRTLNVGEAITPADVAAELHRAGYTESERNALFEKVGQMLPVGRVGEADDLAETYLYLMRERFSTGAMIVVDGGGVLI